jgi:uncharacterized protein with ATP-grasp and redox domains
MITSLDCVPCLARQAVDAARAASGDPLLHERILRDVLGMIAGGDLNQPPPALAQRMHHRLRELTGVADPYRAQKDHSNRLALELLPDLSARVRAATNPFEMAVRFAAAGNIIDLAAKTGLSEFDIKSAIESAVTEPFVGDLSSFYTATATASRILYLTDNAGEIVFDRLLIERLPSGCVTVAVRGAPVINDATRADAEAAGLDRIAEIIDNGSDAPGTVLEDCSAEFRKRFESADVIIAKGQGNFETLCSTHRSIYFLLKIKCPVVASHAGIEVGTQALIHISPDGDGG